MDRKTSDRMIEERERMQSEEERRERRMGAASVTGPWEEDWRGERGTAPYRGRGLTPYSTGLWDSPVAILQHMSEEMDQLFDIFFRRGMDARSQRGSTLSSPVGGFTNRGIWAPEIDMFEKDGQLKIVADLPGMNKDDVQIEFRDGMLVLEGERRDVHEDKANGFRRTERHYGHFYRTIPLPEGVNPEEAKAKFKNGELEITLPAPKRPLGRRLDIQAEDR